MDVAGPIRLPQSKEGSTPEAVARADPAIVRSIGAACSGRCNCDPVGVSPFCISFCMSLRIVSSPFCYYMITLLSVVTQAMTHMLYSNLAPATEAECVLRPAPTGRPRLNL